MWSNHAHTPFWTHHNGAKQYKIGEGIRVPKKWIWYHPVGIIHYHLQVCCGKLVATHLSDKLQRSHKTTPSRGRSLTITKHQQSLTTHPTDQPSNEPSNRLQPSGVLQEISTIASGRPCLFKIPSCQSLIPGDRPGNTHAHYLFLCETLDLFLIYWKLLE